ncbi:MAG: peptidoglycan-binding domain-containing protein [Geminicoccaceae bacterium]
MRLRYWNTGAGAVCVLGLLAGCSAETPTPPAPSLESIASIEPAAPPLSAEIDRVAPDDQFPPNPVPGRCYARVMLPATYEVSEEKVLIKPAEQKIEVNDARYEWVEETIVVKEASKRLETVPAVYDTVSEQILIKPEGKELMTVPAKYKATTERILDKPAHTVWKRSKGPIDNALKTTYDESTGDVMCLVEVPATYRTIEKRTLVTPESVHEITTPAEYETITKKVLKVPATTKEVVIPAEYKMVKVQRLVEPAREQKIEMPAEYETITRKTKTSEESLVWREVLCEVNMTNEIIQAM